MSVRIYNQRGRQAVFVHVPRTGGLWFKEYLTRIPGLGIQVLKGDVDSHYSFLELSQIGWWSDHSFAFVRDPFDWLVSRWSHARSIEAYPDRRHFGIHRLFDEQVCAGFEATVHSIVHNRPGIVGQTYGYMTAGVSRLYQTADLPRAGYLALQDCPGLLTREQHEAAYEALGKVERFNGTSESVREEVEALSPELKRRFLATEKVALAISEMAMRVPRPKELS